ncbi:MAG: ABC transporter substrate-binding protein [Reinekea sp.]|nr:ABC transporter substrate-binding protein [Reinekea sp.]
MKTKTKTTQTKTKNFIFLLCAFALWLSAQAVAETLTIACGAVGQERQYCIDSVQRWSALTGHDVSVINTPDSSSDRLAMYQLLLRERHDTVDVFQIDVVWPGLLHKYLLDLSDYIPLADINAHFPALITNNKVDDRLVAMPWYVDTGLLYYRKDLLQQYGFDVPKTWPELRSIAQKIVDAERVNNPGMTGFVFQADSYEGLTCNFVEWLGAAGRGSMISPQQTIDLNHPESAAVLDFMRSMVRSSLTPETILDYREEDARAVFQDGNAVFMRNWPYAWNLAQQSESAVAGKIGVAPLPGMSEQNAGAGTLGGWQLAVTKYTRHPQLAADLVNFMTSTAEQRTRLALGYFPTRNSLYQQIPSADIQPLFDAVGTTLETAVARPATQLGKDYKDASRAIYVQVHDFLAQESGTGAELLNVLSEEIEHVSMGRVVHN